MSLSVDSERRPRPRGRSTLPVTVPVATARGHWQPASEVSPPAGACQWAQLLSLSCCCYASRRHARRRRGQAGLPLYHMIKWNGPGRCDIKPLSVNGS